MATTKRRTSSRKTTTPSSTRKTATGSRSTTARSSSNPYVVPAIATGTVAAIAAAAAGFWFFRNSDKTVSETAEDISGRIKDGIGEARDKAASGLRSFKEKAAYFFDEEDDADQNEIMEEALSLKQTAPKTERPVDPMIDQQIKTGAVAY